MSDQTSSGPRRARRWLRILAVVFILLLAFVALAPTFVSWGLGQGIVRSAINQNINGRVAIDRLSVGWFSDQAINGLTITGPDGEQAAKLDLAVKAGLLKLIAGASHLDATISGTITGEVREDNSLSLQDLIVRKPATVEPAPRPPTEKGPFKLPEMPAVTVNVAGLDLNLTNPSKNQTLNIDDLTGKLAYTEPAQPITIDLHGKTVANGAPGSIEVKGQAANLFDSARAISLRGASAKLDVAVTAMPLPVALPGSAEAAQVQTLALNLASDDLTGRIVLSLDSLVQVGAHPASHVKTDASVSNLLTADGKLTMSGAAAHINASAENVPVDTPDVNALVQAFTLTIVSEDLTKNLTLAIDSRGNVESHQSSTLTGNLALAEPFAPDGSLTVAIMEKATGSLTGRAIPTPVLQPFLNTTPIVATRDVGPVADFDAQFAAGAQREIVLTAVGENARLELKANVNPAAADRPIQGTHLLLAAPAAHPDLIFGYTQMRVDRPTDVEIKLTSFTLPPRDPVTNAMPLSQYAAAGSLKMNGPTTLTMPAAVAEPDANADQSATNAPPRQFTVQNVMVNFTSPLLSQHVDVNGSANVEGANITFNERITNLFDAQGELVAAASNPVGTVQIDGLPAEVIARFVPPAQADAIREIVGPSLSATVATELQQQGLYATLTATGPNLNMNVGGMRLANELQFHGGNVGVTVTPQLAALAQKNSTQPIVLAAPMTADFNLQAFTMAATGPGTYAEPNEPIRTGVTLSDFMLDNLPSTTERVAFSRTAGEFDVMREGTGYGLGFNIDSLVRRPSSDSDIMKMRCRGRVSDRADGLKSAIDLGLADIAMPQLERVLGKQNSEYSQWTGNGQIRVQAQGLNDVYQVAVSTVLDNLKGSFEGGLANDVLTLAGTTEYFAVRKAVLERRMNAPPPVAEALEEDDETAEGDADALPVQLVTVDADVPMSLDVQKLQLPLAMMRGEIFDPKAVDLQLNFAGGPLRTTNSQGVKSTLHDIQLNVSGDDLAQGIVFTLKGKAGAVDPAAESSAGAKSGDLDVNGKLVDLLSPESKLQLDRAKLEMTAKAASMPTAAVDALANMQGLLIAAVGPEMNATFVANNFSMYTGAITADIQTPNGFLKGPVKGRKQTLRITKNAPLTAELAITPPLRDRLLYKIHPLLADIRTTEQPMRMKVGPAVSPLDGDVSKLRADIEITIGKVELDSGSTTLKVFTFLDKAEKKKTIPGEIEPIIATIRNGVVKYEKFAVHIDKYTLTYFGEINLKTQTVDLHTEIPLKALKHDIEELRDYADQIVVPLVTRGKFGDLKTQIDPDFDIGKAALDAGFQGSLNELLKGKGGLFKDLFDKIGGGK